MDVSQIKLELESSKENLLQTIIKNSSDLDAGTISEAIKEFAKNHKRYSIEKNRLLDLISKP